MIELWAFQLYWTLIQPWIVWHHAGLSSQWFWTEQTQGIQESLVKCASKGVNWLVLTCMRKRLLQLVQPPASKLNQAAQMFVVFQPCRVVLVIRALLRTLLYCPGVSENQPWTAEKERRGPVTQGFSPQSDDGNPSYCHSWLCPRNEVLNRFHTSEEKKVMEAVSHDFDLPATWLWPNWYEEKWQQVTGAREKMSSEFLYFIRKDGILPAFVSGPGHLDQQL